MGKKPSKRIPSALPPEKPTAAVKVFDAVRYELPILVFLLILFVPQKIGVEEDIYTAINIFDYSIGFAPRLFVGSLMSLFTDYKSLAFMNGFMNAVSAITLLLFTFLAGRLIRKADPETRDTVILLVCLFIAVPYSISALYPRLHSIERFLVLFTVLSLIVINRKGWKWLVPVFILSGLASYHGFAFTYMPAVAVVLIYGVFRENKSRQSIVLCVIGFVTMGVFSAYFFLYPGISSYETVEELILSVAGKTDYIIGTESSFSFGRPYTDIVGMLLIKTPSEFWQNAQLGNNILGGLREELRALFVLSPLVLLFSYVWINALRRSKHKLERFVFLLCLLAPLARTPMYVLSQNFFRGRVAVVVVQFFLLFHFIYTKNEAIRAAIVDVGVWIKSNPLTVLLAVAYFAAPFLSYKTGPWWRQIIEFFSSV